MRVAYLASIMSLLICSFACRPKSDCVEKWGWRPEQCDPAPPEEFPDYYVFLGDSPGGYRYAWTDNLQGVTHDEDHWFFTQSGRLWKIPVGEYLREGKYEGFESVYLSDLGLPGPYDHFGDIDYAEHGGVGYVFAPVTGEGTAPIIAAINSNTLELAAYSRIQAEINCGWCAVRPEAAGTFLYTSARITTETPIMKYAVDWPELERGAEFLTGPAIPYRLWDGRQEIEIDYMQGGVFSPADHLYLVNGFCRNFDEARGKIWVFDAADSENALLVETSTNGYGWFNFEWHTDCDTLCVCDEPEGITIWDLDDGRAPCIAGQLHVLMIDNESSRGDRLYFKHYTTSPMDQCKI